MSRDKLERIMWTVVEVVAGMASAAGIAAAQRGEGRETRVQIRIRRTTKAEE